MMWSAGIAIFSGEHDLKGTAKKVVTHPCVLACAIGLFMMVQGWIFPEPLLSLLQTLGRCNTALSMLVIGMILSDIDLKNLADKTVARYTVERLVLIPLLIWIVLLPLVRAKILSSFTVNLSILLAAMPAGATTSMLASKYECSPDFATRMVILSTLCSIPTIFLWSIVLA
jgi:predicted permease